MYLFFKTIKRVCDERQTTQIFFTNKKKKNDTRLKRNILYDKGKHCIRFIAFYNLLHVHKYFNVHK